MVPSQSLQCMHNINCLKKFFYIIDLLFIEFTIICCFILKTYHVYLIFGFRSQEACENSRPSAGSEEGRLFSQPRSQLLLSSCPLCNMVDIHVFLLL